MGKVWGFAPDLFPQVFERGGAVSTPKIDDFRPRSKTIRSKGPLGNHPCAGVIHVPTWMTVSRDDGGTRVARRSRKLQCCNLYSAELKGPRTLLRIRPEIFDVEPGFGLKLGQTKPKIPGTSPTNRHTTIPNDSGPISACFDDDPKLLNGEIAQSSLDLRGWR